MTTPSPVLSKLMTRGNEFLGSQYPIMCGAMTWVSEPKLVSAVCNHGGFGAIAGGNTPVDILRAQIHEMRQLTQKPFGVNLITIAPLYQEHIKLVIEEKVPYVVFAGAIPKSEEVAAVKASGAKTICFAPQISLAERMIKAGADALVIEGTEAGGHIGPVSTMVLLQEILFKLRDTVPVFVAGGIATGEMMAHVLSMGAAGVQLGTRFVMTEECQVHDDFKNIFRRAKSREAAATLQMDPRVPVVPVRAIENEGTKEFSKLQLALLRQVEAGEIDAKSAQLEIEKFWVGALRKAAKDGDVKAGSVMAGQSVGLVNQVTSMAQLFDDLITGANSELTRMTALLK